MGPGEMDVSTIWQSGEYKNRGDATVHVSIHGLHYRTGIFKGVCIYDTDRGPATFRWEGHLKRLYQSAKPYDMGIPYTHEELTEATLEVIRHNDLSDGHIRPITFYGYDSLGVSPKDNPTEIAIATWSWGTYLGEDVLENGAGVTVSSWRKHASSQISTNAKTTRLYVNSMFAGEKTHRSDYIETVVLNKESNVAEGPGENIFMVRGGKIYAPGLSRSILDGITHDAAITLARERGYEVDDSATINRGELNTADELLFIGSAAEVTPIRKVDDVVIGKGTRDLVTEELQSAFFDLVERRTDNHEGWFTYVDKQ